MKNILLNVRYATMTSAMCEWVGSASAATQPRTTLETRHPRYTYLVVDPGLVPVVDDLGTCFR